MPPVLSVPVPGEWPSSKKRKGINALSDLAVWNYANHEIIGMFVTIYAYANSSLSSSILDAARETWRSPAYAHYTVEVHRVFDTTQDPPTPYEILFRFVCKDNCEDHPAQYRGRTKTGSGTTTLLDKAKECEARRSGVQVDESKSADSGRPLYSEARHRAILAIWSAHGRRSFESLTDEFHQMEVEYLRPGTKLPSPVTISRDVKAIHAKYAPKVRDYFQVWFQRFS